MRLRTHMVAQARMSSFNHMCPIPPVSFSFPHCRKEIVRFYSTNKDPRLPSVRL